jgi:hypothetical protein
LSAAIAVAGRFPVVNLRLPLSVSRKLLLPRRAVRHRRSSSAIVNTVGKIGVALSASLCFPVTKPRP